MRKFLRVLLICVVLISALCTMCSLMNEQADNSAYDDMDRYLGAQEVVIVPDNEKDNVFEYQINYEWEELLSINKEIVGWIYIPDNDYINYPVVKGTNNSFYLNHDYARKWNANGAAFVDYRYNNLCLNKIIYAHNMSRSSSRPMFTSLTDWADEEYFNSHRILYYTDANGITSKYLIAGVCGFNVNKEKTFSYLDMSFETEEEFREWVEYIKQNSQYFDLGDNEIEYRADEVLTLSTCDSRFGYFNNRSTGRRVLFCVNLTNNELEEQAKMDDTFIDDYINKE